VQERSFTADGIPLLWVVPDRVEGPLALWMSHLGGSKEQCLPMLRELDQGHGDRYSNWLRSHLDPMLHVESYARGVDIAFECGGDDTHVPADGAARFKERLAELDAAAGSRIRVTEHPGLDHLGAARSPELTAACAAFLAG